MPYMKCRSCPLSLKNGARPKVVRGHPAGVDKAQAGLLPPLSDGIAGLYSPPSPAQASLSSSPNALGPKCCPIGHRQEFRLLAPHLTTKILSWATWGRKGGWVGAFKLDYLIVYYMHMLLDHTLAELIVYCNSIIKFLNAYMICLMHYCGSVDGWMNGWMDGLLATCQSASHLCSQPVSMPASQPVCYQKRYRTPKKILQCTIYQNLMCNMAIWGPIVGKISEFRTIWPILVTLNSTCVSSKCQNLLKF